MHTHRTRRVALALAAFALVLGTIGLTASPSGAASCTIAPQLRDITINQGLGSYAPLAAGKTTLVRTYFSLPSCAGNGAAIEVRGASLTVTGGTTANVTPSPAPTTPYAQVATYATAPALDSPADLKFVVPASAMSNLTNSAFTATFTLSLTYGWKASGSSFTAGTATFTTKSGSSAPITAAVAKPTNNLRVLVVPIGNRSDTSGIQYPAAAVSAVQNGMQTLSRLYAVRDGVGDLATAGNGIRYTALPTLLDVGPSGLNLMQVLPDGSNIPKFCIKGGTWATLKGALSQQLQAWNSANPTAQADRVVATVWQDVSGSASFGCNDGLSTISSPEAVIRLYPDGASPSSTGALLAHELEHTMGAVATPPGDGGYHSTSQAADGTSPNRDYNVTTRQFLGTTDRSVMYPGTTANNVNGLLEQTDYSLVQCTLTPGATGCPLPGSVGTAASGPAIVISGATDGTVAGTSLHSYFDSSIERGGIDPSSAYTLVQFNGANQIGSPIGLRAKTAEPNENGGAPSTATRVAIDVAIQLDASATSFQVRKGAATLYTRALDAAPTMVTSTGLTLQNVTNYTNVAGDDTQPALTSDGALLAWTDGTGIRVRPLDKSAPANTTPLPGAEASWSQSKDASGKWHLLYSAANGSVHDVTVTTGASGVTFSNDQTLYNANVLGLGNAPGRHASYDSTGMKVVLEINGDLWVLSLGAPFTPSNPIVCAISPLLGNGCSRIVATSSVEKNPSVSPANVIAYQRDADIYTATLTGASQVKKTAASPGINPTWGGGVLGFARNGNVMALDADGTVSTITNGGTDSWPALNGAANLIAFDRPASGRDVFAGMLSRGFVTSTVTDDHPGNLKLDIFVDCAGTLFPVGVAVSPTTVGATSATFTFSVDPSTVCNGGALVLRATDGWQTVSNGGGPTGAQHGPVGAIYSPPTGSSWLQFDAIPVSGLGLDVEDKTLPDANLTWSLSGPGSAAHVIGTGRTLADQQPPANGWAVGTWTVTLTVKDSSNQTSTVSVSYVIEKDSDHDGWKASLDKSCGGADGDNDPTNANGDNDGDAIANRDDSQPCVSANNATINFDPNTLNTGSSGTPVTVYITFNGGNLNNVPQSDVRIVQIGNIATNITASYWCPTSNTAATAQFDRTTINNFLIQNGLVGLYVPFVIQGSNATQTFTFRGVDASSPITS